MALDAFFNNISNGADKIAVIGCGCSLATEPIAEISSYWNITHVSRKYVLPLFYILKMHGSLHFCPRCTVRLEATVYHKRQYSCKLLGMYWSNSTLCLCFLKPQVSLNKIRRYPPLLIQYIMHI